MAITGVIRTRKDGGCSICRASDENVGKRRCVHVLDNAVFSVKKEKGTHFIDIDGTIDGEDSQLTMKASSEKIKSYISSLSDGLSDTEKKNILMALRNE